MENRNYPFTDIKIVQTYRPLECAVQWRIDPAFSDITPFTFTVQVSEAQDFSEILYTVPAGTGFYAVDTSNLRQGNAIDLFYRVKLETGASHVFYSATVTFWAKGEKRALHLKAKEIVRKEFVRYRYTGQKGWVLKRKNYGEHNPENLDPITGAPLTDSRSDLGTGFIGGYYAPLPVTYSREGIESTSQLSPEGFGTSTQEAQKHRYVGFPIIEPYDVLVTDTNQRYRYSKVSPTFMPGTELLLLQVCEASLLPPTDPVYSIQI